MSGRKRLRKLIRFTIFLVILFPVSAALVYFIWYSPTFLIKGVELNGADLPQEEVNDLLGGDPIGWNILFWRPGSGHVLDPRFSSMDIERNYLSRTIEVSVRERERNMVWCFESNNACYWVDESGFIFGRAPLFSGSLVVVVMDYRPIPLEIGSYVLVSSMNDILHEILAILAKLELRYDRIHLENLSLRELVVLAKGGPKIIFSLDIDPAFTETALTSLIKTDTWSKMISLNLTVPDRAYPSY